MPCCAVSCGVVSCIQAGQHADEEVGAAELRIAEADASAAAATAECNEAIAAASAAKQQAAAARAEAARLAAEVAAVKQAAEAQAIDARQQLTAKDRWVFCANLSNYGLNCMPHTSVVFKYGLCKVLGTFQAAETACGIPARQQLHRGA